MADDGLRQRGGTTDAAGPRQRGAAAAPPSGWQGPALDGFPAARQPAPSAPPDKEAEEEAEEEEDEGGDIPEPPHSAEDDALFYTALAAFFAAIVLAAAAPLEGKAVSLAGLAAFLLGAAALIFSQGTRNALPLALGVSVACGALGLIFGGILQDVLRYAMLDLTGLRALGVGR
jgi:hypothetical protein